MKASEVPSAKDLLDTRAQLKSRLAKVAQAQNINDLFGLLNGTGLEGAVLVNARQNVSDFIQVGINGIETQLAQLGVDLDV